MNLQENIQRIKQMMGLLTEVEQNNSQNKILYPLSIGGEKTLILLPGSGENGGQGNSDFNELATNLGSDFSVYTANFPNELDVRKYTQEIANEINNNPNIRSFAVGGFSIGGAMAWHLARILEEENVKKFNNKLFLIDSGIPDSTDKFVEDMIAGNTPRVAIAQPLSVFIKNRNGNNLTPDEEKQIKNFYTLEELNIFKNYKGVKDNYLEYVGSMFPPSSEEILRTAKDSNPWIIEDKYDTTNFETRYNVKPKEIKGETFEKGDVIDYKDFAERDTKKKIGLGRELTDGGIMGPLKNVEVISLLAGQKKEGEKTPEEIDNVKSEVNNITNNPNSRVEVINAQHNNITSSKELVNKISELF
jgi:hypothetical protein